MGSGAHILDEGRTPEEWCSLFKKRGMLVSPRSLRADARRLEQCHIIGHGAMIITPDQMDKILEEKKCRLNRTRGVKRGGPVGASNSTVSQSRTISGSAQAHLQKLARGNG